MRFFEFFECDLVRQFPGIPQPELMVIHPQLRMGTKIIAVNDRVDHRFAQSILRIDHIFLAADALVIKAVFKVFDPQDFDRLFNLGKKIAFNDIGAYHFAFRDEPSHLQKRRRKILARVFGKKKDRGPLQLSFFHQIQFFQDQPCISFAGDKGEPFLCQLLELPDGGGVNIFKRCPRFHDRLPRYAGRGQ